MSILHMHRVYGGLTLPVPFLRYQAADLPATSGVNRWPNVGAGGRGYDAVPMANMVAPASYNYAGQSGIRFATGDVLSSQVQILDPASAYTIVVVAHMLGNTSEYRSIAGCGRFQDTGTMNDVLVGGSITPFYLDFLNNGVRGSGGSIADFFCLAYTVSSPGADNKASVHTLLNDVETGDSAVSVNLLGSPLFLGGGAYPGYYQNKPPFLLLHAELYRQQLTPTQLLLASRKARAQYGL